MKKKIIALSLLLPITANAQNIDLQSVIKEAVTESNESKIALINRSNSSFDLTIAKSKFLPTVSFNGSLVRQKRAGEFTKNTTLNSLALTYNLYNGGIDSLAVSVAELEKAKAKLEFHNSINDIIMNTTKLYFELISQNELLKSYVMAEKRAFLSMEIEKTRFDEGASSKTSYLRAESAYYNFKSLNINTEAQIHGFNTEFTRIVGTAPPKVLPVPVLDFLAVPKTLTDALLQASTKNVSLLTAVINKVIATKNAEIAANANHPTLSFSTEAGINQDSESSWSAGVNYSMPLYTGNQITANARKADMQKKLMQQVFIKTQSDVNIEVISSWKEYLAAQGTVTSSQKSLLASAMITDEANIRYDSGEMSVTELMKAQEDHLTIKERYYEALSQRAMAKLKLLNITGGLDISLLSDASPTLGVK